MTPHDRIFLPHVTKPVTVITYKAYAGPLNARDLVNIAGITNGSIHTLAEGIISLSGIPVDGTITIGSYRYQRISSTYRRIW